MSFFFRQIRECLKLDPDHKDCFPHYKKVKKLVKQLQETQNYINKGNYEECIDKAKQILKTESKIFHYFLQAHSHMCHCYSKVNKTSVKFRQLFNKNNLGDLFIVGKLRSEM